MLSYKCCSEKILRWQECALAFRTFPNNRLYKYIIMKRRRRRISSFLILVPSHDVSRRWRRSRTSYVHGISSIADDGADTSGSMRRLRWMWNRDLAGAECISRRMPAARRNRCEGPAGDRVGALETGRTSAATSPGGPRCNLYISSAHKGKRGRCELWQN